MYQKVWLKNIMHLATLFFLHLATHFGKVCDAPYLAGCIVELTYIIIHICVSQKF